jgi:hypothetical protein
MQKVSGIALKIDNFNVSVEVVQHILKGAKIILSSPGKCIPENCITQDPRRGRRFCIRIRDVLQDDEEFSVKGTLP